MLAVWREVGIPTGSSSHVVVANSALQIFVASNVKSFVVMRGSRKACPEILLVLGSDRLEEFHVDCW
jgi:hypothetical protein